MDTIVSLKESVEVALESIRPYLQADGGNVRVIDVSDTGIAYVELLGACSSCPMSEMTLKAGVEDAIKKAVPQIISVVSVKTPIKIS